MKGSLTCLIRSWINRQESELMRQLLAM